jgi:hypothetical protein
MSKRKETRKIEAVVEPDGRVRLSQPVRLTGPRRAVLTIMIDEPADISETALLSEPALALDWDRPEEDEAWAKLQSEQ